MGAEFKGCTYFTRAGNPCGAERSVEGAKAVLGDPTSMPLRVDSAVHLEKLGVILPKLEAESTTTEEWSKAVLYEAAKVAEKGMPTTTEEGYCAMVNNCPFRKTPVRHRRK